MKIGLKRRLPPSWLLTAILPVVPVLFSPWELAAFADDTFQAGVPGRAGNILIGRDINLTGVTVGGNLSAGGSVRGERCRIGGNVSAGGDIALKDCGTPRQLSAGGALTLENVPVRGNIAAGGNATLQGGRVDGDISLGGEALIRKTAVDGNLTLGGQAATLEGATVGGVRFAGDEPAGRSSVLHHDGNSGVIIGGNKSVVSVGRRGVSVVNGYIVTGAADRTTVVTPGQAVYINGRKASGDGPEDYESFRALTSGAPRVTGPGWPSVSDGAQRLPGDTRRQPVRNQLSLRAGSVVRGDVVFESGWGRVTLQGGSSVSGKIVNGERVEESGD